MSEQAEGGTTAFWGDANDDVALRRYRTLVNTVDDGIYQLDAAGRFVAVNDVIVEMCGYSREELLGEPATLLLEDGDVERIGHDIYNRLESGERLDEMYEFEVRTADGESIPCELRLSLLVEDGTFQGTIGVVRDISDRKRQEEQAEAVLESYETITSVLDEADVGVFVLDEEFDIAWVDETAERYFGIDRDAVVGCNKRELIEETLRDRVADGDAFADTLLAAYDENSGVEHFEYRVTSDGEHDARWLEHRSKPIESGRYAGGRVELCYDITEQHRRAHQLQQLNEAVRSWLQETSRDAVADRATRDLRDILNMDINGIFLYDPTLQALRPACWTETAETLFGELPTFPENESIAWRVFESKQPEVYGDVTEAPDVYDPDTPVRSEIVLPIGEHGVVIIGSRQIEAFDDDDLTLAKIVASSLETTFDRLHHERRLKRERDLTDQILDVTPVGTLVLDAGGEVTRVNERAAELLGIEDPETFSPADIPKYDENGARLSIDEQPFAKALATGEPVYDHILQVERPDGERRWLSINAVPITDEDGGINRVVTTSEDVTDLKDHERNLQTELDEIFGRVSDAFYGLDDEFRFTHVNDRAEELLQHSEEELLGERLWDVFPEAAATDDVRESFHTAMETQEPTSYERHFDTLGFWVRANIYPSASGVSVYFRDVTDRKEREQELQLFRNLIDQSNDSVLVIEPDTGELRDVNDTACDRLGYDRNDLLELSVTDIETKFPDRDAWRSHVEDVRSEGSLTVEGRHRRADGTVVPVEVNVSYVEQDREYMIAIARDVTERRERERKLEESERRYRTLAEYFPNGIVTLFDHDLKYTLAAGQGFDRIPITPGDVEGESFRDVWDESTTDALESAFEAALDGEERSVELEYADREWVVHAVPITDDRGDVFAGMTMAQDITERKEYERKLRQRERNLEQYKEYTDDILDAIDDIFYVVDEDFAYQRWNESLCEVTGYSDPEIESMHPLANVAEADREAIARGMSEIFETGTARVEADVLTKGGERIPYEFAASALEDPAGNRVLAGIGRDITERKERERELERRARQQRVVADLGQFALEADGLDELMREAARQVADVLDNDYCKVLELDRDAEDLLLRQGVGWREGIVGTATVSSVEARSQAAVTLANEEPIVVQDLAADDRIDGPDLLTSHDVTSGISTVIGSIDDPWGILGTHDTAPEEFTSEDVSFVQSVANVLAEAIERNRYQDELEQLIDDLEESNERLEQFAYAASHDLQEPLRMITSYLQLIERRYGDALDEEGKQFLEFAVDGAERMRDMIDALLEYSRVETQGDPFEPVDLDAVLEDARDDLQIQIENSNAEINAKALPQIPGDDSQLRQVFQNLLSNAIEYSGDEPPRVHVSAERVGDRWRIAVRDEGIGIDPEQTDRVFEVFQRLHTHDEHSGTGIGLALVKRIVERHGGDICVESEPDEGSTFYFTLPATDATSE